MKKGFCNLCLWVLCLLALLGVDIFSKQWALSHIPFIHWYEPYPFHGLGIFQWKGITFSLNLVTNMGAAWGMFSGYPGVLFALRIFLICGLVIFLVFFNKHKRASFPLWLIVVGALGNGLDYCRYGCVIDLFHFTFWGFSFPVFNVADSYITLGALSTLYASRNPYNWL